MNYTKGEWTFIEHQDGAWGSSTDDGMQIPRMSYWLYSPLPDYQCVATFTHKHDAERVCTLLNDPKRKAAPDMYEALKAIDHYLCDSPPHNMKLKEYAARLMEQALAKASSK